MKKHIFLGLIICLLFTGCGKYGEKDLIKDLTKKVEKTEGYNLNGTLEIINNEDKFTYDVDVAYKKENNFRVSLKNQINNHEQIILRNKDGVYVLTPSLNKSFKFESDWPYNNSQSYLLQAIISDINNDTEKEYNKTEEGYLITTKVNYTNNKNLKKQKIYINNDKDVTKVEVLDENDNPQMTMNIENIDYKANYEDSYFELDNNMKVSKELEKPTTKIEEIIYPMYLPENTYLKSEEKLETTSGERIIMTFAGEKPFMLVQETANIGNIVIPSNGEPYLLASTIGLIEEKSLNWENNGIEYYLASDKLTSEELVAVANSLATMAVSK